MANLNGTDRSRYVRDMFERIAPRYDLMNRIMTAGQDQRWRQRVIERSFLPEHGRLLDLGTGTGDLGRAALKQEPEISVFAADFTVEMMQVGISHQKLDANQSIKSWLAADAEHLPFPDNYFDAVVSGFLYRNLADLRRALEEQFRVLKPAGRLVALDTTPPPRSPFRPVLEFYLQTLIPLLGKLIAKQIEAYRYLPASTEGFLHPEQLAARILEAGFRDVGFERRMFGTIAIHWGQKPGDF
jgi:demethylmenaquinone methyltransferase/2-methoxy-6-polyprenyl-1,4-benzoquinol methylase